MGVQANMQFTIWFMHNIHCANPFCWFHYFFFYHPSLFNSVELHFFFILHCERNFPACSYDKFCIMCKPYINSGRYSNLLNNSLYSENMLILSKLWIMLTHLTRFNLSEESFLSIGVRMKHSLYNIPFLSTVISTFLEMHILSFVYSVSHIFAGFICGLVFLLW